MPGVPSLGDGETEADAECRAHYGRALDGFSYVPRMQANRLLDPAELSAARREALILAREVGRLQTGGPVDDGWCRRALAAIGLATLGVASWDAEQEDNQAALRAVVEAVRAQAQAARVAATEEELARQGSPF